MKKMQKGITPRKPAPLLGFCFDVTTNNRAHKKIRASDLRCRFGRLDGLMARILVIDRLHLPTTNCPQKSHLAVAFRFCRWLFVFCRLGRPYFLNLICFPLGSISTLPPSIARAFCMASWFAPSSCFWIC